MKKPDIPQGEEARLKTLRSLNILDTSPEERFDRLTRMAKRMFGVPIALVSLVDENRQWFKSSVGLDASETPRDISFCGHTILGSDVFIISDASKDERFADNPLVVGDPKIRFYVGCPLRFTDGSTLGTLCIIDREPRVLSQDDLEFLKDLALTAERELAAIELATLDDLTHIPNRRGFMMVAQHSLQLCVRQKIPATLVYLDLDNFKMINDTFGHGEGNRVLMTFAAQISALCRKSDYVARLGGDEFVMLLTNVTQDLADLIIARLKKSLDDHTNDLKLDYEITFSYGTIEYSIDKHASIEALLEHGDSLMYEYKKARKA